MLLGKFLSSMGTNVLALLVFSMAVLILYYLLPKKFRPIFLLGVNLLFYLVCDWKMAAVLVAAILWTWFCGIKIGQEKKKGWLAAGVVSAVALLGFFKYANVFADKLNQLLALVGLGSAGGALVILMPLGISYYIFKAISYLVDVYRGKYEAEKNLSTYALYLSFFPEILSGPISRFDQFRQGLETGMDYSGDNMQRGFYFILKGLFLKGVIANRLAGYVGTVFAAPGSHNWLALWMAAFFYAFQLYCDFSGYSSIAIGITRLFGLHHQDNFLRPYLATDIREFWDRWHISLSTWLRDYVYFPLGGSRCAKWRSKLNVLIVFLVSGLWHGVGLQYVAWGAYHGILNMLTPRRRSKEPRRGIKRWLLIFLNFCLVTFGWILFGSGSLGNAAAYVRGMFSGIALNMDVIQTAVLPFTSDNTCVAFFLIAVAFILILLVREIWEEHKKADGSYLPGMVWQVFLLTCVILFGNFAVSGFIYANF